MGDLTREIEKLEELVRYYARKWQLGYSIERREREDEVEVRFGKSLPPGLEACGEKDADSYWVAVRLTRKAAPYWANEIEGAVQQMVEGLVRMIKPHRALTQPEAGHG